LNIPEKAMHNFLEAIELGYRDNPYHAAVHSADVLQTCIYFTAQGVGALLNDIDVLLLIISAAIHDYDHPGVNNAFLITTGHPLAIQYNDRSVLEVSSILLTTSGLQLLTDAIAHNASQSLI
jgi:3',5'-cyclic-nucleotide phosphodiesterase